MKKIFALSLVLSFALVLSGCFFPFGATDEFAEGMEWVFNEISKIADEGNAPESLPDESGEISDTDENSVTDESVPDESVNIDESSEAQNSEEESKNDEPDDGVAVIDNLVEFRDFINENKENDNFNVEFVYTGDIGELDGITIARISTACCINYAEYDGRCFVTIYEYPGDRIADAYLTKDTSKLNKDEMKTLSVAKQMLEDIKEKVNNEFELELAIHDAIAEKVSYYDGSTDVPDELNPPRHLTAVGALLDGKANCQGYTDAFYLLATMAGFDVGRMTVMADEPHIVNTIKLDGEWYVVDVTFNDTATSEDDAPCFYYLFNAGRDMCVYYEWGEEMEYNPISNNSGDDYFYFYTDLLSDYGYEKTYTDIDALAQMMFDEWYYDKTETVHGFLLNEACDWTALRDAFENADIPKGVKYEYSIWALENGVDTYFIVEFE